MEGMIVVALFEIKEELVGDSNGEVYNIPVRDCKAYAVFKDGEIISPVFDSYGEAQKWMDSKKTISPKM